MRKARFIKLAGAFLLIGFAMPALAANCPDGHVVRPRDTLYSIGRACGVAVPDLIRANPFVANVHALETGLRLGMPGARRLRSSSLPGAATDDALPLPGIYQVGRGDTLYGIARRFGTTPAELIAINPGLEPERIEVGQPIRVARAASAPSAADLSEKRRIARETTGPLSAPRQEAPSPRSDPRTAPDLRPSREAPKRARPETSSPRGATRLTGVVTDEGIECPSLRSETGELWTLAGSLGRIDPGDHLAVEGREIDVNACLQGRTMLVEHVRNQRGG